MVAAAAGTRVAADPCLRNMRPSFRLSWLLPHHWGPLVLLRLAAAWCAAAATAATHLFL